MIETKKGEYLRIFIYLICKQTSTLTWNYAIFNDWDVIKSTNHLLFQYFDD